MLLQNHRFCVPAETNQRRHGARDWIESMGLVRDHASSGLVLVPIACVLLARFFLGGAQEA